MRAIIDPGPIKLVDVLGEPIREPVIDANGQQARDEKGQPKTRQAEATLPKFLLGLCATAEFIGELKGMDAAVLVLEARKAIQAWPEGPGPKPIENAHHEAFCRTIKTTEFNHPIAHNFVPFMRAVVDAKDVPAAIAALPEQPAGN